MDKSAVTSAFAAAGLARLNKDIDSLIKSSIRLHTTFVAESTLKVGASKLGGLPDLPIGSNWPEYQGLPLSFVAQLQLSEVHGYDVEHVLPPAGMLWFFYDAQQQTFGDAPQERDGWRILFSADADQRLQRSIAPGKLPAASRFKACAISFAQEITLPQQPRLEVPNLDWTDEELQKYGTLLSTFPNAADHSSIHNRLLGHPDTIQDDMRMQCQLAPAGITDMNDPRVAALSKSALDWQLLLQIDSDEHAAMRWASNGMLYYWIKQADLKVQQFDRTWLVLQAE